MTTLFPRRAPRDLFEGGPLIATSTPRRAPVQGETHDRHGKRCNQPDGTISWEEHIEAWKAYARLYSRQSAERIAVRGGFGWSELCDLLGHEPTTWRPIDDEEVRMMDEETEGDDDQ